MTKQAVDHSEVNVFLSKKDSKYAKELLRKSKESNWKVFRVNCSGRGGVTRNQLSRDQLQRDQFSRNQFSQNQLLSRSIPIHLFV